MGQCRDCRWWNGATERAAPCFVIVGQYGRAYDIDKDHAAFMVPESQVNVSYLITGPDFGCTKFQAGKPVGWGG